MPKTGVTFLLVDKLGNHIRGAKISLQNPHGYHTTFTNAEGLALIKCESTYDHERLYIDDRYYGQVDVEDGALVKVKL